MSGGLVAAAFALKYPLVGIPNVEPLTLAFFAVGYAYGIPWGAFVGAAGEALYATINPFGPPIVPVWAAQIVSMMIVGMVGGWIGRLDSRRRWSNKTTVTIIVGAGIGVTIIFDLLTNLALAVSIGPFWPVMLAAVPFAGIHIASNALLFLTVFPILRRWFLRSTSVVEPPGA
ncbi:MAG: ECF transporter S component [candidate division Zixibacteria bacterium]|nr:ECF transporter S component [candidate division Zixibacteria bacterium]